MTPQVGFQDRFHVVLVEPGNSLNVGTVARAMSNLGFGHLHLVAPPHYNPEVAATSACWGDQVLAGAKIHASLEDCLAPMAHVVGFAAQSGANRPQHLWLGQWSHMMLAQDLGPTALLFGPEDHGLELRHLTHCRYLIRIPAHAENPSYNLAQAVLLALAELSRPTWQTEQTTTPAAPPGRPPAQVGQVAQLHHLVDEAMAQVRFYGPGTPRPIPDMVHHLLNRLEPDEREVAILLGMFGKINKALAGKIPVVASPPNPRMAANPRITGGAKDAPPTPLPPPLLTLDGNEKQNRNPP